MPKCALHPGRDSVATIYEKNYCANCRDGITAARTRVGRPVEPKECFIWYASNDNWQPIAGTGCAHWVSHQLNIHAGPTGERCLGGFTFRVHALALSHTVVSNISQVRVNDIWVSPWQDHTGLVIRVAPPAQAGGQPTITIRHDSNSLGGVVESDFATYFNGRGTFYR